MPRQSKFCRCCRRLHSWQSHACHASNSRVISACSVLPATLLSENPQEPGQPHDILSLRRDRARYADDAGGSVDIQGVCKSTVVRGEDDFPIGVLRVSDCHDTVVYALAPLQYVKIAACSDCQVR